MKKADVSKLPTGVDQVFVDNIQAMTIDQLTSLIVALQIQNQENEAFKESEGYLRAVDEFSLAKERHSLVVKPVKDVTVSIKNKTKLVVERLKEKGAV